MKAHSDRTIQAALITGVCVIIAALITCPHWLTLLDRTGNAGSKVDRMKAAPSTSVGHSPGRLPNDHQNVQPADPVYLERAREKPNPDLTAPAGSAWVEPDQQSGDVNYPKPSSLRKTQEEYILPGDIRGDVNTPNEKELPPIPDNTIEPDES